MQKFVFIFRQSNFPMNEELQKRRAEEVRVWATRLRDAGYTLEPHLLDEERYVADPAGHNAPVNSDKLGDPVIAILFVDATNFEEAKKTAATHPGLRYGVSVEVRASTSPAFAPTPAVTASR
jgi:hypothetical protein